MDVGSVSDSLEPMPFPRNWQYNAKDGHLKFEILTDDLFPWMIEQVETKDNMEEVIDMIQKKFEIRKDFFFST